jgi:hypothetical protein
VKNFANNRHKGAYRYLLTPQGLKAKTRLAGRFLQRKLAEYEALEHEIAQLRAEVAKRPAAPDRWQPVGSISAAAPRTTRPRLPEYGASAPCRACSRKRTMPAAAPRTPSAPPEYGAQAPYRSRIGTWR